MSTRFVRAISAALASGSVALLTACAWVGGGAAPGLPSAGVTLTSNEAQNLLGGHVGPDVPILGGCPMFPADNPWNTDVSQVPVDPNSANYMAHMNAGTTFLHPDFGHNPTYGFPITIAPPSQPFVPITFTAYGSQSDPGPYPIPPTAKVEGGKHSTGDRHVVVLYQGNCHLYEMFRAFYVNPGWKAGSGAIFDLSSDKLRPDCWTSADAAGLPITPALPRVDEVNAGLINHAMQFTVAKTQAAYVHPATHFASSSTDPNDPPMGLRVRLKATFNLSHFHGQSLVILTALKKYGMMLAQNGSDWYMGGSADPRWNDADLHQIKTVPASAFEVVQLGTIYTHC
jgi:hypothetical protein